MAQNDPSFLGRGWSFPPRFDGHTGQAYLSQAEEDIVESLRILMETRPGERVMHPTYGCKLHDLVFEPMNGETQAAIRVAITHAILFFEPRITLKSVSVVPSDWANGVLRVELGYTVNQTNTRHNMVFPYYIREGTLVSDLPIPVE
ncbi:GPW/gp25 family protein [uncultured Roseobacter sp.]|uniref:GPW/gp25 family protein n=1 Tax=uncultured Roseobacter sp. TaxID=114847 RepID=UPI00260DD3E7|nr:GPW/gp25 family protein [uncultured Roseobacter sp.]